MGPPMLGFIPRAELISANSRTDRMHLPPASGLEFSFDSIILFTVAITCSQVSSKVILLPVPAEPKLFPSTLGLPTAEVLYEIVNLVLGFAIALQLTAAEYIAFANVTPPETRSISC